MGFFASLFGQKTSPAPRPAVAASPAPARSGQPARASSGPLPGPESIATQPRPEGALDVPALLVQARAHLDRQDLPAALQLYEQIAATDGELGGPLTTISGDLGATGHLEALIEFLAPRYDPATHGMAPGLNLLQAYLHRRNAGAAQQLLDLLTPLVTTYSMRDRLDGFRCAIAELRAAAPAEPAPTGPAPDIHLINISRPIWTYGLEQGENTLPTKTARVRQLAVLPIALVGDGVAEGKIAPPDHPLAPVVRGLPLALAEACWFAPAYRPTAVTGIDQEKNLLLAPRAFVAGQVRQLFPSDQDPIDYAIAGTLRAAPGGVIGSLEFVIWDIRKSKLLKTFRLDGPDALARAWPQLLGYIEAARPGPAPIDYALPADPVAHATALDHVLHFFLAEKGVVPPETLAPHLPRLAALAAYAAAHPDAVVPGLILRAAIRHCEALGLEVPPEIATAAGPAENQ